MPKVVSSIVTQLKQDVIDEIDHLESCRSASAAEVKLALLEIAEDAKGRAEALDETDTSIIGESEVSL